MFDHTHPAYQHWLEWGKEVRALHQQGVIRGLVFVSAHWQAEDLGQGVYGMYIASQSYESRIVASYYLHFIL